MKPEAINTRSAKLERKESLVDLLDANKGMSSPKEPHWRPAS